MLCAQEGPGQDDGDLPGPFAERHVEDALRVEDHRAVHENVDAAEGVSRAGDRRPNLRLVGHVAHDSDRFAPALLDRVGASVGVVLSCTSTQTIRAPASAMPSAIPPQMFGLVPVRKATLLWSFTARTTDATIG